MDVGEGMRLFFDVGFYDHATARVALNLTKYMPKDAVLTCGPESAELVILHVVGRHDHVAKAAAKMRANGQQYAIIQYVLGSCRNPDPKDWLEIWGGAKVVWSYYDLHEYVPGLYHAPLAADPDIFFKENAEKKYMVGTVGQTYQAECFGEVRLAAFQAGGKVLHIGPPIAPDPNMEWFQDVTDDQLRLLYNQCHHFSALRRKDGFELIAVEALLCGVRPVMFDTPDYRFWFDGLADFVPEDNPGEVVAHLGMLFRSKVKPVTDAEIEETRLRFDWKKVVTGFWEKCYA